MCIHKKIMPITEKIIKDHHKKRQNGILVKFSLIVIRERYPPNVSQLQASLGRYFLGDVEVESTATATPGEERRFFD
jgi:hypothetical protein